MAAGATAAGGYGGWRRGYGGYGGGLLGWGLPSWSLGTWPYPYGYTSYSNPYYAAIQTVVANPVYDYSQPIAVDTRRRRPRRRSRRPRPASTPRGPRSRAAITRPPCGEIDQAIKNLPNDPDLHEFRALTLFALGRYTEAAAVLYSVLSVRPGWNWATLIGFYPDVDTFTAQLRTLERYCAEHPNEAPPRFVLAYLYTDDGVDRRRGRRAPRRGPAPARRPALGAAPGRPHVDRPDRQPAAGTPSRAVSPTPPRPRPRRRAT